MYLTKEFLTRGAVVQFIVHHALLESYFDSLLRLQVDSRVCEVSSFLLRSYLCREACSGLWIWCLARCVAPCVGPVGSNSCMDAKR